MVSVAGKKRLPTISCALAATEIAASEPASAAPSQAGLDIENSSFAMTEYAGRHEAVALSGERRRTSCTVRAGGETGARVGRDRPQHMEQAGGQELPDQTRHRARPASPRRCTGCSDRSHEPRCRGLPATDPRSSVCGTLWQMTANGSAAADAASGARLSNRPCSAIARIATKPTARRIPRIVRNAPKPSAATMPNGDTRRQGVLFHFPHLVHVRFGSLADIPASQLDVCSTPIADIRRKLCESVECHKQTSIA